MDGHFRLYHANQTAMESSAPSTICSFMGQLQIAEVLKTSFKTVLCIQCGLRRYQHAALGSPQTIENKCPGGFCYACSQIIMSMSGNCARTRNLSSKSQSCRPQSAPLAGSTAAKSNIHKVQFVLVKLYLQYLISLAACFIDITHQQLCILLVHGLLTWFTAREQNAKFSTTNHVG